jgi:hypothetical protein
MIKRYHKVYGPYKSKDGRKRVRVMFADGSTPTYQYAKWLMMLHMDRELDPDTETVDHINRDFTDDRLENLRVVPRSQHVSEDQRRAKPVEIVCVLCGTKALKSGNQLRGNAKKRKAGPFCSRECAGKYGASVQNGGKELGRTEYNQREYYNVNKH